MMSLKILFLVGLFLLLIPSSAFAEEYSAEFDDIAPYTGMFGSDHALYKFKLMLERFDEGLTFNPVKKMEKKMNHAQLRLAEAKREMLFNRVQNADMTMELYKEKMVDVNADMSKAIASPQTENMRIGLENMQVHMERHRLVVQKMKQDNDDLMVNTAIMEQIRTQLKEHTGNTITAKLRYNGIE